MIRYGYAIRVGGDPEISGALRDGMERGTAAAGTSSVTAAPCHLPQRGRLGKRAEEGLRNVALRRHSPEELEAMIEEAQVIYGGRRYTPRWAEALLVGYALICYGVSLAIRARDGGDRRVW